MKELKKEYERIIEKKRIEKRGFKVDEILYLISSNNIHYLNTLNSKLNYTLKRYKQVKVIERIDYKDILSEYYLNLLNIKEKKGGTFVISEKISLLKAFQKTYFLKSDERNINDELKAVLKVDGMNINRLIERIEKGLLNNVILKDERIIKYLYKIRKEKNKYLKYQLKIRMLEYSKKRFKDLKV